MRFQTSLAVMTLLASPVLAAEGELDPLFFGSGQQVITEGLGIIASALAVGPDGALVVVAAELTAGGGNNAVWYRVGDSSHSLPCRLTPPSGASSVHFRDAIFDAQGRLLMVGGVVYPGGQRLGLARYLYPSCALDPAFDGDGLLDLDLPSGSFGEVANAVALHPTANWIALAGEVHAPPGGDAAAMFVALLNADGVPITAFDDDGWRALAPTGSLSDITIASAVAFSPANRIVVGGEADYDQLNTDFVIARVELDGELDLLFGDNGYARVGFDLVEDGFDALAALAIDPTSGAIVAAGEVEGPDGNRIALARLTTNGALDDGFHLDGRFTGNPCATEDTGASGVAVDGLGRIVATGYCFDPSGATYLALRLTPTGNLDPAFGTDGWTQIPFGEGDYILATEVETWSGRIAFAGTVDSALALARLDIALLLADSFELGGTHSWSDAVP